MRRRGAKSLHPDQSFLRLGAPQSWPAGERNDQLSNANWKEKKKSSLGLAFSFLEFAFVSEGGKVLSALSGKGGH